MIVARPDHQDDDHRRLPLGDDAQVTPFFNIVRAHNRGAAFSFLADASGWQRWFFIGLGLAASVFIVWMLRAPPARGCSASRWPDPRRRARQRDRPPAARPRRRLLPGRTGSSALLPGFNVADSAITVGAALLILDELRRVRAHAEGECGVSRRCRASRAGCGPGWRGAGRCCARGSAGARPSGPPPRSPSRLAMHSTMRSCSSCSQAALPGGSCRATISEQRDTVSTR